MFPLRLFPLRLFPLRLFPLRLFPLRPTHAIRRRSILALAAGVILGAGCGRGSSSGREILLAAAASLRAVLPELAAAHGARRPGVRVVATYGSSGDLRRQVEAGAPVDGVLFAGAQPLDDLVRSGRVDGAARRVLATNELVLVGPRGGPPLTFATIDALPAGERLAIGDPGPVPAGHYARELLERLGKWEALRPRLVLGGDVSAVLAYVRRGEVAAGIVYRTEVRGIDDLVVLDAARGSSAPRPVVVGAPVKGAGGAAEAEAFLDFAGSPDGHAILARFGFGPP